MGVLLLLQNSFTAMFPMISLTFTGVILTYMKILDKDTNPKIVNLGVNYFALILNFIYISSALDFNELEGIWPLFAIPLFFNLFFISINYFITGLGIYPKSMRNTFTIFLSITNYGLVFTLSSGICSPYGPLGENEYCSESFSYISIYNFTQIFVYWIVGYTLVGRDKKLARVESEEDMIETPAIKEKTLCQTVLDNIKSPNPISCIIGIIFAMIPGFKSLLFYHDSPLFSIAKSLKDMGFLAVFLAQLVLGSNIYMMFGVKSNLPRKALIFSVVHNVLLKPAAALAIIYFFWSIRIFGDNRLMAYIIYISTSCPPAIVAMIFAMLHKVNLNEVIESMFWIYIFSLLSLVLWTFLFFTLI